MTVLHRIDPFEIPPPACRSAVVSIGNFDGVHRGHAHLIARLRHAARRAGTPAIACTFDPHPVRILRPDQSPLPLTWTERKAELLHEAGVDQVVVLRTTAELLGLAPDEFFARIVRDGLAAQGLVEGPNFGFGRGRTGNIETLGRLAAPLGIAIDVVEPIEVDGAIVSSSRVRELLAAGRLDQAERLLGRPHRLRGTVQAGARRGTSLGFPTANLRSCDTLVPADGVYAARARVGGGSWPAAVHIGPNPTFGDAERKVEAHLIGFSGDLLGHALELDLLARLRDTRRFAGAHELAAQLRRDVTQAAECAARSDAAR